MIEKHSFLNGAISFQYVDIEQWTNTHFFPVIQTAQMKHVMEESTISFQANPVDSTRMKIA